MTILHKPIKRETMTKWRNRPLIIQLEPADIEHNVPHIIRIKEKGRRLWYEIPLETVFYEAAKRYAEKQRREKLKEKARKGNKIAMKYCQQRRIKF